MDEYLRSHFQEQQERINISDEDWGEYEERTRQQKIKRKRARSWDGNHETKTEVETSHRTNDANEHDELPRKRKCLESQPDSLSSDLPHSAPRPCHALPAEEQDSVQEMAVSSSFSRAAGPRVVRPRKLPSVRVIDGASYSSNPPATPLHTSAFPSDAPSFHVTTNNDTANVESERSEPQSKSFQNDQDHRDVRRRAQQKKSIAHEELLAKKSALQRKREADRQKVEQREKESRMTPLEYASILQEKWASRIANTPSEKLFLTDKVIFLVCEEKNNVQNDTKIKFDIIAKHGGKVATVYDPSIVTHIIPASTTINLKKTLRVLGLKSISDIPSNIKTVKWDWIVSGLSKRAPDSEIMHELFKSRMALHYPFRRSSETVRSKGKAKEAARHISAEHSIIQDFTTLHDSPKDDEEHVIPTSPHSGAIPAAEKATIKHEPEDPLLPFYARAREEAEAEDSGEDSNSYQQKSEVSHRQGRCKGFQCDRKGSHVKSFSPNWDIIEKLAELRELHRESGTKDDMWRVISYQKAIGSLKSHPTRIKCHEEAITLAGISDKTADKIMEIIKTGELRRIGYTKSEDLNVIRLFNGIYGVGSNTARKWYNDGFRTLDDLRQAVDEGKHKLSAAQEIGLRYYDDINDRMPRAEAQEIFDKIKSIALGLDPELSLEIMGSFRRGKETCGDLDILLTRPTNDGCTHAGILPRLCHLLRRHGILTEDLATPDEWGALEASYRGLCRGDPSAKRRRIDILCVPYDCRGAARIYYTGDDIFNRSIRLKAHKMGMSLNQRGLYEGVIRDPQDARKKICTGSLLCSHSERKIFEILGVPWQEPHERVRSG